MPSTPDNIIIAIDGPAGAGKSTVAKEIARRLNISYLDTGAMYRALTLFALQRKINLEDETPLVALAKEAKIELIKCNEQITVWLNGNEVTQDIRTNAVTENTFYIARTPAVREIMVNWQREMARQHSVVAEGRDIGTVVFPNAHFKFYLDANLEERAKRRYSELEAKGETLDFQHLKTSVHQRDEKDKTRSVGPLKQAQDAVYIDTTHLSIDQVVEKLLQIIQG